jgi:hypothetical protein
MIYVTFLSLNKKVTKEVSLRGANVALPRARYALLRISRGALYKLHQNVPLHFQKGGGGISKGGAFARSAPLLRILLVLFLT